MSNQRKDGGWSYGANLMRARGKIAVESITFTTGDTTSVLWPIVPELSQRRAAALARADAAAGEGATNMSDADRCQTCRHWDRDGRYPFRGEGVGRECLNWDIRAQLMVEGSPWGKGPGLCMAPDFGCVQWESR